MIAGQIRPSFLVKTGKISTLIDNVDNLLWKPVSVDGLFEKGGSHRFISTLVKHEIKCVAEFINGSI